MTGNNALRVGGKESNLSEGIGKPSNSGKDIKNAAMSFMDMMKNSTPLPQQMNTADNKTNNIGTSVMGTKGTGNQNSYEPYTSVKKSIEPKKELTTEDLKADSSGKLDEFENKIKEVLQEELGLTEEQIQSAMEKLGMSATDLTDVKNLTKLVQVLTGGQDIGTLLLSESFQNIMLQASSLTKQLCQELGVSMEELTALCKEISEMQDVVSTEAPDTAVMDDAAFENDIKQDGALPSDTKNVDSAATTSDSLGNVDPNEEGAPDLKTVESEADTGNKEIGSKEDLQETAASKNISSDNEPEENIVKGDVSKADILSEEETPKAEQVSVINTDETTDESADSVPEEKIVNAIAEEAEPKDKEFQDSKKDSLMEHSGGKTTEHTANPSSITNGQSTLVQPFSEVAAQSGQAMAHNVNIDIADVIEQITKNAKVTFAAQSTTMEMQLNPENLGRIYLHITEKEGAVRAEIAAQTETVKNALEAQIVDLRQSLNQQGIKVDAIEVSVATHEFEQNLDSNARQEEQLSQQMAENAKKIRRNLNLSDLDQISGLMTEEETLVAKMMQENGNQVDLNA